MKRIILAGLLALLSISGAHAQCSGIQIGGTVCGNPAATGALASQTRSPVLGVPGSALGTLGLAGNTSGLITMQPQAAAGTYNWNLPTGAGTAGQPLLSGGGGAAAMTFGTLGVAGGGTGAATLTGILQGNGTGAITGITNSSTTGQTLRVTGASTYAWGALDLSNANAVVNALPVNRGGTNASVASGTALDNITGFSSTGYINRTGAGTYSFSTISTILDSISSTRGSILYRGAAGWAALAPGASTNVLTSNGAGADPSYQAGGTGTVTSVAAGTGLSASPSPIVTAGTISLSAARQTLPTTQRFTTAVSNQTYTTPANTLWIEVFITGGGGGGGGNTNNGSAGGASCWNTSGVACTSPVFSAGGGGGGTGNSANGGGTSGAVSGSSTCSVFSISGAVGGNMVGSNGTTGVRGGNGAASHWGGGGIGAYGANGTGGAVPGAGGGGGANSAGLSNNGGAGGGSGAFCRTIINSPAASYTYTVGAGGAGSAGDSFSNGGAGFRGEIIVIEHYGSWLLRRDFAPANDNDPERNMPVGINMAA